MSDAHKLLIIEDDVPTVMILESCFEFIEAEVELLKATRGMEGVLLCKNENPEVVILDLGLPDMDGSEVVHQVRQFSNTPIVITSARSRDEVPRELANYSEIYYSLKPFDVNDFLLKINTLLIRNT